MYVAARAEPSASVNGVMSFAVTGLALAAVTEVCRIELPVKFYNVGSPIVCRQLLLVYALCSYSAEVKVTI